MRSEGELTTDTERPSLERLLRPRSIAVAGGLEAAEVLRQCQRIGFDGELYAIHPTRESMEGVRCVRSAAELPVAPDACFIAVRAEATVALVADLAARGAGGAVCYASGFAEVGEAGAHLQRQLLDAARGMPFLGPNCYGLLNYLDGAALWPDRHGGERLPVDGRGVALLTQSGNIALNLTMQRRHLPLACVAALGNAASTDFHHLIDALSADPRISAIGLHIEGLGDVAAFAAAAQRALARGVPLVALKTGNSALGAQLAASHTSALAGPAALYGALFDRLGIAQVEDLAELLETLKLLHAGGPLAGRRVGALSCSGGEASLVADLGEAAGLEYPPLGDTAQARLLEVLGPKVPLGNPLDYHTYIWGNVPALTDCFAGLMEAPIDLALLVLDFPFHEGDRPIGWDESLEAFVAACARRGCRGAIVSTLPELMPAAQSLRLQAAGIASMQGLRDAVAAVRSAAFIGERRAAVASMPPLHAPARLVGPKIHPLDEASAKQALSAHGVQVPAGRVVDAPLMSDRIAQALAAATVVGWPVVLKAVASDLAHKTEQQAVHLNLRHADQLRAAAEKLAGFDRWLVEKMVSGAVAELIVGVTRDPQFGTTLTIGAGGVMVELLADSVTLLLPTSASEVERALRRLKCFALLDGFRGRPRADLQAVVHSVLAIAAYAESQASRLIELDVNPLIVTANGAIAADALIRLASSD